MSSQNKKIALYPGTFDPITKGHLSLIDRAGRLFDELIVAVAASSSKQTLFTIDERVAMIEDAIKETSSDVRVVKFDGLLAEFAQTSGACAIIRGLRAVSDFEYEFQMALMNRRIAHDIETVFLMPALSWVYLSSTIVKDVASNGGDVTDLVPDLTGRMLKKKFS